MKTKKDTKTFIRVKCKTCGIETVKRDSHNCFYCGGMVEIIKEEKEPEVITK